MVTVAGHGGRDVRLHRLAAEAWAALTVTARADGIAEPLLQPMSGYRSVAEQQSTWQRAVERYGSEQAARRWVAPPGNSPHHSGRAVDCWMGSSINSANADSQRGTAVWRWLDANASRFGFYPYSAEPWHWEYNPPTR
ncbi:D-alanyl-D-alanine carboxypeptidase family protein [Actinotalea sp. K2]|nr:D-alanyl-D-alanine carboxypeptidase family protein [Actinotalea sp. K2]